MQIRHAQAIYTAIKYSPKPFMGSAMGVQGAKDSIQMASILFGSRDELSRKPRMISILCSLTPLVYDERMLGAIMEYARVGQPQLISSLAICRRNITGNPGGDIGRPKCRSAGRYCPHSADS